MHTTYMPAFFAWGYSDVPDLQPARLHKYLHVQGTLLATVRTNSDVDTKLGRLGGVKSGSRCKHKRLAPKTRWHCTLTKLTAGS